MPLKPATLKPVTTRISLCLLNPHLRLYNKPGMNPLSPNWVIVFYSLPFYKVSRFITYDKYGEQAWLLVACSILQPICNLESTVAIPKCPQVLRTGEQNLNLLAGTGTGWLMSFERQLCQTKAIVLLSFWTFNLPRILEVSCSKS